MTQLSKNQYPVLMPQLRYREITIRKSNNQIIDLSCDNILDIVW